MFWKKTSLILVISIIASVSTILAKDGEVYLSNKDAITNFDCYEFDTSDLLEGEIHYSETTYANSSGEIVCQIWSGAVTPRDSKQFISIKVWKYTEGWNGPLENQDEYAKVIDMLEESFDLHIEMGIVDEWSWINAEGWTYAYTSMSTHENDLRAGYSADFMLVANNATIECRFRVKLDAAFDEQAIVEFCDTVREELLVS